MKVAVRSRLFTARKFGFDSALGVTDQALSAAISFLVAIYIGRQIGVSALGIFAITNVLILAVHALLNGTVLEAMTVLGPRRDKSERAEYFGFLLCGQILTAAGFTGLMALLTLLMAAGELIGQIWLTPIFACLCYANLFGLQLFFRRSFYVERRLGAACAQSSMFLAMVLAGLLLLSLFGDPTVPRVYGVMSVCSAVICIWRMREAWLRLVFPDAKGVRQYITEHWRYGRWVLLTVPFVIGSYQGYYLLAGYLLGNDQAGLLKAVDTLILPFDQVLVGLSLFLIPLSAGRIDIMSTDRQRVWAYQLSLGFLLLSLVYAALLLTTGGYFLELIFGGDLSAAMTILPIMAILPVLRAIAVPAGIALTALRRPDLKCYSYIVSSAATITLGAVLVHVFGVFGAALGLVCSLGLFAATQWLCLTWLWRR